MTTALLPEEETPVPSFALLSTTTTATFRERLSKIEDAIETVRERLSKIEDVSITSREQIAENRKNLSIAARICFLEQRLWGFTKSPNFQSLQTRLALLEFDAVKPLVWPPEPAAEAAETKQCAGGEGEAKKETEEEDGEKTWMEELFKQSLQVGGEQERERIRGERASPLYLELDGRLKVLERWANIKDGEGEEGVSLFRDVPIEFEQSSRLAHIQKKWGIVFAPNLIMNHTGESFNFDTLGFLQQLSILEAFIASGGTHYY